MNKANKAKEQFQIMWEEYLGDREGAAELLKWMEEEEMYNCPASAKHHLAQSGGWIIHTVNVAINAVNLCKLPQFRERVDKKEAVVAALLHDLCKLGKYRVGYDGKYHYTDNRMLGHGEESVVLAMQHIQLYRNEMLAIRWHMGAYTGERDWNTLGKAYNACPLALLLHFADMMATHYDEVE